MNERIKLLAKQAEQWAKKATWSVDPAIGDRPYEELFQEKFAELLVEECREVITKVYRQTPLELCGPLLTADEEIAKHFYGVKE